MNESIDILLDAIAGFLISASSTIRGGNQETSYLAQINEVRKLLGDVELLLPTLRQEDVQEPDAFDYLSADDFASE